jgi:hypothetical protein
MGRNSESSSELDIVMEKALNLAYERGWQDCKKTIITLILKDTERGFLDKDKLVNMIEKV